jgi:hypothetical protein
MFQLGDALSFTGGVAVTALLTNMSNEHGSLFLSGLLFGTAVLLAYTSKKP